jgi:energy-coupling factor transporter ATP-binding protein EcfA2
MALRILRLFVELNRLGTTVLIATHDEELVARARQTHLHLEHGREAGRPLSDMSLSTPPAGGPARCCRRATPATARWSSWSPCSASWPA